MGFESLEPHHSDMPTPKDASSLEPGSHRTGRDPYLGVTSQRKLRGETRLLQSGLFECIVTSLISVRESYFRSSFI